MRLVHILEGSKSILCISKSILCISLIKMCVSRTLDASLKIVI